MDATWPDSAVYACPCGTLFAVTYWRWVDVVARPELEAQVRHDGPFEGTCTRCGAPPRCAATWLRIDPSGHTAELMVAEARRGHIFAELREHLDAVAQRPHAVSDWMLQPTPLYYELDDEGAAKAQSNVAEAKAKAPQPVVAARSGELFIDVPPPPSSPALSGNHSAPVLLEQRTDRAEPSVSSSDARPRPATPESPRSSARTCGRPGTFRPPVLGAYVGTLALEDDTVVARATVDASERDKWTSAKLAARPIHARGLSYPLLGIRFVAVFMGQKAVVDAVIDPGKPEGGDVFRLLSKSFRAQLVIDTGDGGAPIERDVTGNQLEPNAALCLESSRSLLARGEYPPAEYDKAVEELAALSVEARLKPPAVTISAGAYQHLVGAAEAQAALEHLTKASNKEHLARLLEVEGVPMGEYDALRRRVLAGSLEHGLVAPRRFWRRVVASGLVEDLGAYARQLSENRARCEGEEGDLEPAEAKAAWERIHQLCKRKDLPVPPELASALGLPGASTPPPAPEGDAGGSGAVAQRLRDPSQRLKVAAEVLQGRLGGELGDVFDAIEDFDTDELLALLPDLSELGPRAVPSLVPKLSSERREIRQAAAILLGLALDPRRPRAPRQAPDRRADQRLARRRAVAGGVWSHLVAAAVPGASSSGSHRVRAAGGRARRAGTGRSRALGWGGWAR